MKIDRQMPHTFRAVPTIYKINSREQSTIKYQMGMSIAEGVTGPLSEPYAEQGTIVDQVRRKRGAWTVNSLASFLDVSPKLLYKLVKSGKLNAYRIGTSIRIDGRDAASYLETHTTIPQKQQLSKPR